MDKKYIYLDHTADAKFQAFGTTLEEAFVNSACAMIGVMCDIPRRNPSRKKYIRVTGKDKESLLCNFLEEVLFLFDSGHFLTFNVPKLTIIERGSSYFLSATLSGDSAEKYEFFSLVKGITYNEMFVKEEFFGRKKKFIIQVVVDI